MDEDLAATLLAEVLEGEDMAGIRLRVGIGPEDGEETESTGSVRSDEGAVDEDEDFIVNGNLGQAAPVFSADAGQGSDDDGSSSAGEDDEDNVVVEPLKRSAGQRRGQRVVQGATEGTFTVVRKEFTCCDKSRIYREWMEWKSEDLEKVRKGEVGDGYLFAKFKNWVSKKYPGKLVHFKEQIEKWEKHVGNNSPSAERLRKSLSFCARVEFG